MNDPRYQSADDLLGTVRPHALARHVGWADDGTGIAPVVPCCGPCHREGTVTPLVAVDGESAVSWSCPAHGPQAWRMEGGVLNLGLVREEADDVSMFTEEFGTIDRVVVTSLTFPRPCPYVAESQTITERIDGVMAHYGFAPPAPSTSWQDEAAIDAASVWADMWRRLAGAHARDRARHRVRERMLAKQMAARTPIGAWWWGRKLARLR